MQASDYALMLKLLKAQEVNSYLSPGFPSTLVFAHKTTELAGVTHDAGVLLESPSHSVYVTVMTEGDYAPSLALMQDIAQLIWREMIR